MLRTRPLPAPHHIETGPGTEKTSPPCTRTPALPSEPRSPDGSSPGVDGRVQGSLNVKRSGEILSKWQGL